eukprot:Clim_evm17s34 gene=Clim_evmTU17s34
MGESEYKPRKVVRNQDPGKRKAAAGPCDEFREASYKCLDMNDYDRTACERVFEEYKECQRMYSTSLREHRRARWLGEE